MYSAGHDIDTYCSRCKLELAHVIIALSAGQPVRVLCKTCNSEHAFRKPKRKTTGVTKRAATKKSTASAPQGPLSTEAYHQMLSGRDLSRSRRYTIKETFEVDDIVDHKKFGIGLVTKCSGTKRSKLHFERARRFLSTTGRNQKHATNLPPPTFDRSFHREIPKYHRLTAFFEMKRGLRTSN